MDNARVRCSTSSLAMEMYADENHSEKLLYIHFMGYDIQKKWKKSVGMDVEKLKSCALWWKYKM